MGEMSEYYCDPVEAYLEEDRLIEEEARELKRKKNMETKKIVAEVVLMGYNSEGSLVINKKLSLNDEQVSFFKALVKGENKVLLLKEDVEEVYGTYNSQLTYHIEFK